MQVDMSLIPGLSGLYLHSANFTLACTGSNDNQNRKHTTVNSIVSL